MNRLAVVLSLFILLAAPMVAAHSPEGMESAVVTKPELLEKSGQYDVVYGKEDAPLTLVEYASLSCPHCKAYHDMVFGKIKETYIDTGKVRYFYRNFPLNLPALRATMLVNCVKAESKSTLLDALFVSQASWAFEKSEPEFLNKIRVVAKVAGMTDTEVDSCLANKELEDGLLNAQLEASKGLGISSTPTLFIGGKKFGEAKSFENVSKEIDKQLSEKGVK